jgi:hypothetical protein
MFYFYGWEHDNNCPQDWAFRVGHEIGGARNSKAADSDDVMIGYH